MANRNVSETTRRQALKLAAVTPVLSLFAPVFASNAPDTKNFIDEAFRMRDEAIAAGDQAYGAVMVLDGHIVGYGPSRVVADSNVDAHAERVALWDAQKQLGRGDLFGAVMYSTSRPCPACQAALAKARVARLRFGRDGADGGPPQSSSL